MLHGHPCQPSLQVRQIWRHQLLPIAIYRSLKKTAENVTSHGFGSNFSGAAFCLPHHLVDILLFYLYYLRNGGTNNADVLLIAILSFVFSLQTERRLVDIMTMSFRWCSCLSKESSTVRNMNRICSDCWEFVLMWLTALRRCWITSSNRFVTSAGWLDTAS